MPRACPSSADSLYIWFERLADRCHAASSKMADASNHPACRTDPQRPAKLTAEQPLPHYQNYRPP